MLCMYDSRIRRVSMCRLTLVAQCGDMIRPMVKYFVAHTHQATRKNDSDQKQRPADETVPVLSWPDVRYVTMTSRGNLDAGALGSALGLVDHSGGLSLANPCSLKVLVATRLPGANSSATQVSSYAKSKSHPRLGLSQKKVIPP